jgi:hypothetical protein
VAGAAGAGAIGLDPVKLDLRERGGSWAFSFDAGEVVDVERREGDRGRGTEAS